MINDLPPVDDFRVGVYRTLDEVFKDKTDISNGIIFRDERNLLVSVKGAMMQVTFDSAFSFKGLPKYSRPADSTDPSSITIETVDRIKNNTNGITQADLSKIVNNIMGAVDNSIKENKQFKEDLNYSNEQSSSAQDGVIAPSLQQEAPQNINTTDNVDKYSNDKYAKALDAAKLDINAIYKEIEKDSTISNENKAVLKAILPEVKDAYTDGNDYIYVATKTTNGNITTGVIKGGYLRFTKSDWENQSALVKKYKK